MREYIRNKDKLLSHGNIAGRRLVLELAERVLSRLDAGKRIRSILRMEGDTLHVGNRSWDLSKKKNVYLIAAGKAANAMVMAMEEALGGRLTRGIAIVKVLEPSDVYHKTEVYAGGHPLPNEEGLRASQKIMELADFARPEDLFICGMSGGSSALMSCPLSGITLEDEINATDLLLKSGAGILEINAVRRHISAVNGGRLAERIEKRGAEMIGFNISDAVYNPPTGDIGEPWKNFFGTPMGPDQTTLADARRVIEERNLKEKLPKSVTDYIFNCGPEGETPKAFPRNTYFQLNTLPDSCAYALEEAEEMGAPAVVLTTFLEGEAKDLGAFMAAVAKETGKYGRPFKAPCFVLSAGEAVTTIPDSSVITGRGGPSQEMALGFALAAEKAEGACFYSMDTEGTDGTAPAAGGLTDSFTLSAARKAGLDLHAALRGHAAFEALSALGDAVVTGNTGTNLCDLNILYVPALLQEK